MKIVPAWLGVLLLAGCLAPVTEPSGTEPSGTTFPGTIPDSAYASLPFLEVDHDHTDPAFHPGAAAGLTPTAHLALLEHRDGGYFGEMDVMADLLVLAIEQYPAGVVLVDVADPDHPVEASFIDLESAIVADVKLTADARTLFVGTASWALMTGPGRRLNEGPDPTLAKALGILAYDVSDPSNPREVAYLPVGRDGIHMLDVHVIRGETYVFATTPFYSDAMLAESFLPVATPTNAIEILRWSDGRLSPVARYDSPSKTGNEFAHDITVVDDGDQVLMLCAYYDDAAIADVSDPANPRHLGSFSLTDNGIASDVHSVMMTHVGDRRVLVTSPELPNGGEILVLDATDPAAIALLGRWGLPAWDQRSGPEWSPHNVVLQDGKAYLAHYHGGAWVLDLSDEAMLAQPQVRGYFSPPAVAERPTPNLLYGGQMPSTWEVLPAKGRVFVADMGTGLHVLRPDWSVPDEPPYGTRGA